MNIKILNYRTPLKKYFTDRIQTYLASKGKKVIGWTEITHGGISPGLTVQDWLGGAAVEAAKAGNDAIQSPYFQLYLDAPQSDSGEPVAMGYAPNTLDKVYRFSIMPSGLTAEEQKHIIGSEAPLWTEMISTESHLQYMMLPRLQAFAENTWTTESNKDLKDFKDRLYAHYERFDSLKFNSRKLDMPPAQVAPTSVVSCASAVLTAPGKASSYYWTDPTNAQTSTVTVAQSGLYKLYSNYLGKTIITNYDVNIKPAVVKPTVTMSINSDTTFTASGNADNYHWYDAGVGGNLLGTGKSIVTSTAVKTQDLWVSGSQSMLQYGLNLTGANYMSCPPLNVTSNGITFEAWVKATGIQNDIAGIMFFRGSSAHGLNVRSNGQLMYHWNDNYYNWNSGLTLPNNTWVHVALVITQTSATIYLNDKSATNTASHAAAALTSPMLIGFDLGSRFFKGSIDEVRVWNAARTKEQILKNMNVQLTGTEPNLISYFNFNEGLGTSAADQVTAKNASLTNPSGSDWQFSEPCPVLNNNCESERWKVNATTAVKDVDFGGFSVYPNPSNGNFTVVMNGVDAVNSQIKWYDVTGKEMNFVPVGNANGSAQFKSVYQGIPKGVYIVNVMVNNEARKIAKVVVN